MDALCEARLVREFPMLYRHYLDKSSCMHRGFEIGQGWFGLVYELSREIEQAAEKLGVTYKVYVAQVKEKFGSLRFAVRCGSEDDWEAKDPRFLAAAAHIQALAREAEARSATFCEECSKPARLIKEEWWRARCPSCEAKKNKS